MSAFSNTNGIQYIIAEIFLKSPASKTVGHDPMKHSVVQDILNRISKMTVFRFVPFKFPDHNCAGVSWDKLASDPSEKILHYLFGMRVYFSGAGKWRFETYFWLLGILDAVQRCLLLRMMQKTKHLCIQVSKLLLGLSSKSSV